MNAVNIARCRFPRCDRLFSIANGVLVAYQGPGGEVYMPSFFFIGAVPAAGNLSSLVNIIRRLRYVNFVSVPVIAGGLPV